MKPAGSLRRFAAYWIDILPIVALTGSVYWFFFDGDEIVITWLANRRDLELRQRFLSERNLVRDFSTILWVGISTLFESSVWQATPGKKLLGLKVVDEQGEALNRKTALLPNALKIVSALPLGLGFLWALFSKDKRCWHDLWSRSRVIKL